VKQTPLYVRFESGAADRASRPEAGCRISRPTTLRSWLATLPTRTRSPPSSCAPTIAAH